MDGISLAKSQSVRWRDGFEFRSNGSGVFGEFWTVEKEVVEEGLVLAFGPSMGIGFQSFFTSRRKNTGAGSGWSCCEGDTKLSERRSVMSPHVEIDAELLERVLCGVDRSRKFEDGLVFFPRVSSAAPTSLEVAIDTETSVVTIGGRGGGKGKWSLARRSLDFLEKEVAGRTFVVGHAWTVEGKSRIGESFDAEGAGVFGKVFEGESEAVVFGDVSADKDDVFGFKGENGFVALHGGGRERGPIDRVFPQHLKMFFVCSIEGLNSQFLQFLEFGIIGEIGRSQTDFDSFKHMHASKVLSETNAKSSSLSVWWDRVRELEDGELIGVTLFFISSDRPARVRIAVEGMLDGIVVLFE